MGDVWTKRLGLGRREEDTGTSWGKKSVIKSHEEMQQIDAEIRQEAGLCGEKWDCLAKKLDQGECMEFRDGAKNRERKP